MKTTKYILSAIIALFTTISFSSCDDDVYESSILTGEWEGDFGMFYDYHCKRCDDIHTYYADYSHLAFFPDHSGATHGYGRQIDYYIHGPYSKQYYHFYWEIQDGVVYLDYPHNPDLSVEICDYKMHHDSFRGRIGDIRFSLHKVADYDHWNEYGNADYYYYERYDWHSYNRLLPVDSTLEAKAVILNDLTIKKNANDGEIVRRGCTFNEPFKD